MKLVSVDEMRLIEKEANLKGLNNAEMMAHAGTGLAELIEMRFSDKKLLPIVGLVGGGNNGGDTLIALTFLQKKGWDTHALLCKERPNDPLVNDYTNAGGKAIPANEHGFLIKVRSLVQNAGVILDGVLGTGITLPLREDVSKLLKLVGGEIKNQTVIAVDCPSGVNCDSGQTAPDTIKADLTVCFEAVKIGLMRFPAYEYCGEIFVVPIGMEKVEPKVHGKWNVVDIEWVKSVLPARPINAHKGTFGSVMVVGGCINYVGAPMLSGLAAYRTGSGLVTLAVPQSIHPMLAGQFSEATWLVLDDEGGVIAESAASLISTQLSRISALVVGPGIGREDATQRFLDQLFFPQASNGNNRRIGFLAEKAKENSNQEELPPVVLDADGLQWFAKKEDWYKTFRGRLVLTPHPGEMAALTGLTIDEIQSERMGVAANFAKEWQQVIVLKGALTVIAAPDGRTNIIPVASSALAKAGSGDVLSGMIASLIGQGVPCFEAASAAAWLHAQAGLNAADKIGDKASVIARNIIDSIANVFSRLNKNTAG